MIIKKGAMSPISEIELATYDDLQGILNLLESVNVPTDGIDPDFTNFYIIRESTTNTIVGCIGLEHFTGTSLLRSFAVDRKYQGLKIGKKLIEKLLQEATEAGTEAVYVCTAKVPSLFFKFGFTGIDRDDIPTEIRNSKLFVEACPKVASYLKKRIM